MLLYFGLALLISPPAPAKTTWLPDPPVRTETARDADGDEVTCTYYPDLVLRQTQTNTPSPGKTTLARAAASPACLSGAGRSLATAGFSFIGRKGPRLVFEEADANGATAFTIFDARSDRKVISDASLGAISQEGSLRDFSSTPDLLSLSYRRALNTACSILARPATCWRAITRSRRSAVPPSIRNLGPPVQACRASYSLGGVDRSDPSVISYEVKVVVTRRGTRMQANGPIGCSPLP